MIYLYCFFFFILFCFFSWYCIVHKRDTLNHFTPLVDNTYDLGQPNQRWNNIYGHIISTSDAKQKRDIQPISLGLDFLEKMKPVSYRWKDQELIDSQGRPFTRKYVRAHFGFIAQDISNLLREENISTKKFAAFVDDPQGMGLRMDELLPIHTKAIQELSDQVKLLTKRLDDLLG
jgi:hypothetical protein